MSVSAITEGANVREGEFHAWDDMGVEAEVAEFLYALVRVLKPRVVVESGTGRGYASLALAAALAENGEGVLHTLEPIRRFQDEARNGWKGCLSSSTMGSRAKDGTGRPIWCSSTHGAKFGLPISRTGPRPASQWLCMTRTSIARFFPPRVS